MKILDRYIAKNFLTGYVISFCVLIGLRIIIDLFVNLDEFTEHTDLGTLAVIKNILIFYGLNSTLYFRDFAGMITVFAAVFSLGKMIKQNELVAMIASGVGLKRVIAPIVMLSLIFAGVLIVDQEFVIPTLSDKLVRSHDDVPGKESYDIWFLSDENGSLICSENFEVETATLRKPTIILRQRQADSAVWQVTGRISADKAIYNPKAGKWLLINGYKVEKGSQSPLQPVKFYASDLKPKDIPVRRQAVNKTLLSSHQLAVLAAQRNEVRDLAQLYSQKHFRVTEPIINFVMLLVALPILVCRDPKSVKSAVAISFALTTGCFIITFVCKMFATEVVFDHVMPELWAWLPVFVFLPVAFIELDSMKT